MNVSTITVLFKVISGYMFRLDLVILRPILTFVLPDTVHTLGSYRVYVRRIHPLCEFNICLVYHSWVEFMFVVYLFY